MTTIDRSEFIRRFVEYMVNNAGFERFEPDGMPVRQYAETVAATYWGEPDQRAEGPEECAAADMSYWGEG